MLELRIITMHQTFVESLNAAGIDGVRAEYKPTMAYDTIEEHIREIIVTSVTSVGLKFAADWIFDYLKRQPPKETRINNHTITNNAGNVVIIVNNYLEAQREDKKE